MLVCPGCHDSKAVRLARRKGAFDGFFRVLGVHPYRCHLCQTRFRRFGQQEVETSRLGPLPASVSDPTAFKTLRFEGENSLPRFRRASASAGPAPGEGGRRNTIFLARTADVSPHAGASPLNPLAMPPVVFHAGEAPIRTAEHERFDPLVLGQQVVLDEAPLRADGDHLFDPLAMENKVFDRAKQVNSLPSRLHAAFEARAAARRERREFFASEEGLRVLSLWRKRRRWILWSAAALKAVFAAVGTTLYRIGGLQGLEPKRLWLIVSAAYLLVGTVLALIYPRFNAEQQRLRPRFADLTTGWVGFAGFSDFATFVVVFPLLAGGNLNFGFYRTGGVWLWIGYASLAAAAGIGWLVSRLRPMA